MFASNTKRDIEEGMRDLIHELGGVTLIAKTLGVRTNVVSNWLIRGIPWKYRPAVAAIAKKKGIKIPADFLESRRVA